ncbi:unnamed protein product, partial [Ectocarpus sp. 12 AP-2014]
MTPFPLCHMLFLPWPNDLVRALWAAVATAGYLCPTAFASAYTEEVQVAGLEALYYATNGQDWANSTGWSDGSLGVCSWYGVTCDSEGGNVTGISLSNNLLVGDVSEATDLTYVISLEEVDLSDNELSGPVPLNLGMMPNMEILDLSGNEMSHFPAAWGSGASMLRHLSLQNNRISGSLPAAWLNVTDSSSYPLVHLQSSSPWLPELRSLLLGGNNMNATGYAALQTVANWRSLQTLDLSDNALTGSMDDALALYYYCDGSGSSGCGGNVSSVAAPLLRVLKVDGNDLIGSPPRVVDTDNRRIDLLDVSDNGNFVGEVPASYSELLILFAENTSLSGLDLPDFIDATTTTAAGVWNEKSTVHDLFVCPAFKPSADENVVAVTLDHAYDGYSVCTCNDGFQGSGGGSECSECPLGSYRNLEEEDDPLAEGVCSPCPSNSTTLQNGSWLKSQCVCATNFYDEQGGAGSEPSCLACPSGSRTLTAGAVNITSCECEPGRIFNTTSGACEGCAAGTYKPAHGNHIGLCLPCPTGTYSDTVGATSQSFCEKCPVGFYGGSYGLSSVTGCVACPAGTFGAVQGLSSESMCTDCWPGYYSGSVGASSYETCIECPSNHSQPITGASSLLDCIPCDDNQVANEGSAECMDEFSEDGTLIGLYLLIAGIILVVFTLVGVFLQKHCGDAIPVKEKVHMKLNEEMKSFIYGQQFWISLFSGVEIMDLMSDLGAYASLLYTAALTGAMKLVYTIVVAFALVASLHGVHTRAMIILDMQEERMHGLAITGNNMLYYEKQFTILQIMSQKRTCRIHVPFDRGNKYLSHHIGVQRLISLNSMRIIIAIFEDVPFLGLNMFLLMTQPDLASNLVFMMSFVMSIFVLGYKMTLLEKHARLQIRKWNLEARMDTDTMLNKKAARGRRFSWACQQCE